MKIFEAINIHRGLLGWLIASGIGLKDVGYIDLYMEFARMTAEGDKVSYAVAILAEKYNVSERKVYSLIKRFGSDCKSCSA